MTRNDLIDLLTRYNIDNVAITINGAPIDVAVSGTAVSFSADDGIVVSHELIRVLAHRQDADVAIAVGGVFVDICGVSYDEERETFVLRAHPDDLTFAARRLTS